MKFFKVLILVCVIQAHAAFNLNWGIPGTDLDQSPPLGDSDFNATLSLDPNGQAIALWTRTTGKQAAEEVWFSVFNCETRSWIESVCISGGGNASNPAAAFDSVGNAMIIWEEGFPSQIVARTYSAKGIWTPPLSSPPTLVCDSVNTQTMPRIAIDKGGDTLVVWMELYQGLYHIHSAKKLFGGSWTHLGAISNPNNNAQLHFTAPLSMNEKGDAIAVWQETNQETAKSEIHGCQFIKGNWLSPLTLSAESDQHSLFPSVGIDLAGNSVIVWNQFGETSNTIQSRALIDGKLSPVLAISNPNVISQRPHVGVDAKGNAVVVYERYDQGPNDLPSMNKFIAGATLPFKSDHWTNTCDISGPSLNPITVTRTGFPVLSLNALGDGVAIWKECNGDKTIIQSAGYSLGSWSLFKTLSTVHENAGSKIGAYDLAVAINQSGKVVAIWPEDTDGTDAQHIRVVSGVGLAVVSPQPPVVIPQTSDIQIHLPPVELPSVTVPVTHPQLPIPTLTPIAVNADMAPTDKKEEVAVKMDEKLAIQKSISQIDPLPGKQVFHRFPGHGDLINILNWTASPGFIAAYKIYRGSLSSLIGTTQNLRFEDHQRTPGKVETYLITSVDSNGQESTPITIIVPPM